MKRVAISEGIVGQVSALICDPIIIVGAPRSGTSMLFQALSTHPDLWSLYRESQRVLETIMSTVLSAMSRRS